MQVNDFQKEIVKFAQQWDKKRFHISTEQSLFNHLVEEVGELATQFVNKDQRKDKFEESEIDNAIGDIITVAVQLADLRGLKIEELVLKIIEDEQECFQ